MPGEMVFFEGKCVGRRRWLPAVLLGVLLLPGAPPAWSELVPVLPSLPAFDDASGALMPPQGEAPSPELPGVPEMPPSLPGTAPVPYVEPIESAWFAAAGSLESRVERTLHAALEAGRPNLDAPARALLLDESLGSALHRAEGAVRLAPDLPLARIALARALWSEQRDLAGAIDQIGQAARASPRNLEASLWLRSTAFHALFLTCLIGSLLFLLVAGGSLVAATARLLGKLPVAPPLVSRAALVAGLLLIPAALGEGLFGVALGFAALGLSAANRWQCLAVGLALVVSIAGLHFLGDRAAEELVALGSNPAAEAAFAVEHAQPSRFDIDRLKRAPAGDPLVARALALHAKRTGDLESADRHFTALIDEPASASPNLLNNAANVRLALDRTHQAIQLYEAAARQGHLVVVLFNLSQAYGRLIQLDRQDLALAEAQVIDPVALAALTDLYARSPRTLVVDLPVETKTVRARLRDPAAARQAATALRSRFAPGWLGRSPLHSAIGVALAVVLGLGVAAASRSVTRSGEPGALDSAIALLLTRREVADPFPRMVQLAALRDQQARVERIRFLLSLIVPGAAGVVSRHPILGLLASLLFASTLASWYAQEGIGADPLAVGAGAALLFGALSAASAFAYAAVVAVTIALWERS
jgi:tetratricopeptide (TPR) repeat protein